MADNIDRKYTSGQREMHPAKWLLHLHEYSLKHPHDDNDPENDQLFRHEVALGLRYPAEKLPDNNLNPPAAGARIDLIGDAQGFDENVDIQHLTLLREGLAKASSHLKEIAESKCEINMRAYDKAGLRIALTEIKNLMERDVSVENRVFIPGQIYQEADKQVWDVIATAAAERCFLLQEVARREKGKFGEKEKPKGKGEVAAAAKETGALSPAIQAQLNRVLKQAQGKFDEPVPATSLTQNTSQQNKQPGTPVKKEFEIA